MVGTRILRNCWRKTGFDWFPGLVDQEDIVDTTGNDYDTVNGDYGGDASNNDGYDDSLFDSDEEVEESDGGDEKEGGGGKD